MNSWVLFSINDIFEVFKKIWKKVVILPTGGKNAPEQFFGVYIDIRPQTGDPGAAICSMWHIAGNDGDIACMKWAALSIKFHESVVRMANSDFKAVMEMKPVTGNIRNFPMIACKQQDRKVRRQIVAAVFGYSV